MLNKLGHSTHLVHPSPWPLVSAGFAMGMALGAVKLFYLGSTVLLYTSLVGLLMVMAQWWRDVSREGSDLGAHTPVVELGLRWGMVLFIISEVMFFLSFFWAFYHSSMGPSVEVGAAWPPLGVKSFNPMGVPLLNSVILLSSGVSVTWSHHTLLTGAFKETQHSLLLTVALGAYFTSFQALEYYEASFAISDSTYGATFFLATGFHGIHVIIGTIFLLVTLYRITLGGLSAGHCFGFEAAAWYWHFVDVVWLFLFMNIYWWGSL